MIALAQGANVINNYVPKCIAKTHTSVDNPVICNFFFTRPLSPVIYVKTSVVDNIGPCLHINLNKKTVDNLYTGPVGYRSACGNKYPWTQDSHYNMHLR